MRALQALCNSAIKTIERYLVSEVEVRMCAPSSQRSHLDICNCICMYDVGQLVCVCVSVCVFVSVSVCRCAYIRKKKSTHTHTRTCMYVFRVRIIYAYPYAYV